MILQTKISRVKAMEESVSGDGSLPGPQRLNKNL